MSVSRLVSGFLESVVRCHPSAGEGGKGCRKRDWQVSVVVGGIRRCRPQLRRSVGARFEERSLVNSDREGRAPGIRLVVAGGRNKSDTAGNR